MSSSSYGFLCAGRGDYEAAMKHGYLQMDREMRSGNLSLLFLSCVGGNCILIDELDSEGFSDYQTARLTFVVFSSFHLFLMSTSVVFLLTV